MAIIAELSVPHPRLFDVDKARALVKKEWYRSDDDSDDGEGNADSEDENDFSENRLIFDPSFLAEIAPDKPQGFFSRFK